MTRSPLRRLPRWSVIVAIAAVLLAGCSGGRGDDGSTGITSVDPTSTTTALTAPPDVGSAVGGPSADVVNQSMGLFDTTRKALDADLTGVDQGLKAQEGGDL